MAAVFSFGAAAQARLPSGATTFINTYANFMTDGQVSVTPEDVQATSDGGYILLAASFSSEDSVSWLVKIGSLGNPQWVEELGNFNAPPDSYARQPISR